jgi:hypothetical protein
MNKCKGIYKNTAIGCRYFVKPIKKRPAFDRTLIYTFNAFMQIAIRLSFFP